MASVIKDMYIGNDWVATYSMMDTIFRLSEGTFARYVRENNVSYEEAVEHFKKVRREKDKLIVDGKRYRSLTAIAKEFDLSEHLLRRRFKAGESVDSIVHDPKAKRCATDLRKVYVLDGKEFLGRKAILEYVGIKEGTVRSYMHHHGVDYITAINEIRAYREKQAAKKK